MLNIDNSVLVVLDDVERAHGLIETLRGIGFRDIFTAQDNEWAKKSVKKYKPDVIIHDIEMIQMDGLSFLSWLIKIEYRGGVCLYTACEERLLRTIRSMAEKSLNYLGDVQHNEISVGRLASVLSSGRKNFNSDEAERPLPSKRTLLKAIQAGEFCLYAQPKIAVDSKVCIGVELLARWNKDGEILSPFHFVPILQQHPGLLAEFDKTIVTLATMAAAQLHAEFPNMHVAMNTSTPNYNSSEFTEHLMMQMYMSGLDVFGTFGNEWN